MTSRRFGLLGLLLIFVVCFSIRAGSAWKKDIQGQQIKNYGNRFGAEMERAALAVSKAGTIRDVFVDVSWPSAHVSPAYPWIVGTVYRLAGPDWRRMRWTQVLLCCAVSATTAALLPLAARRTGLRPAAGIAAAMALVLLPVYFWEQTNGDWEQPLAGLTLLLLVLDAEAGRRNGWRLRDVVRSGLLLGWSALLSPPVALTGGLMALARFAGAPGEARRIGRGLAIEGLIVAACLAPWTYRNYRELGGFVPLRSNLGLELYVGNHDRASGYFDAATRARQPFGSHVELTEYQQLGEWPYMRRKLASALDWIGSNPGRFARLTAPGRDLLDPDPPLLAQPRGEEPRRRRPDVGRLYLPDEPAGLRRPGVSLPARHPARWTYAAALIAPSLIYFVIHVLPRYRYPTYPIVLLLGAELVVVLVLRVRRGRPSSEERAGGADMPPALTGAESGS